MTENEEYLRLKNHLKMLHDEVKMTWEQMGVLYGMPRGTVWDAAHEEPTDAIVRAKFGMSPKLMCKGCTRRVKVVRIAQKARSRRLSDMSVDQLRLAFKYRTENF